MSYLSKKRFTMRQVVGLLTIVFLGIAAITYAVSFSDFTSGSTISSSEMNTKLNALKDAINKKDTSCQGNSANDVMVKVGPLCVDKYEASVWSSADGTGTAYGVLAGQTAYPGGFPANGNWTTPLYAVSRVNEFPSTGVTWFQAQQACALSGKRLLTNAEWQMAAAGTPDNTNCNVSGVTVADTGTYASCVSNYQVNDMVGNVWEWVADWMQGNTNPWAPSAGTTNATYGSDWVYGTNPATSQGGGLNLSAAIIRGGSWSGGANAGVFALDASRAPSVSDSYFGFRCVR
ncbi:MAG: SUMF1/EgtB/PvdO family nonheme iron enzyme [Nitrospirota bacterium]